MSPTAAVFDPASGTVTATLTGEVGEADVAAWREGLAACLEALPRDGRFALLVDTRGYAPASLAAHRAYREAVADAGEDGRIAAVAFVHHDAYKMRLLQEQEGTGDVGYFADVEEARAWLRHRVAGGILDTPRRRAV